MIQHRFKLVVFLLTSSLVLCSSQKYRDPQRAFYNYISEAEPLDLMIEIKNSTHIVFQKNYPIIYSLDLQPEIQQQITFPVNLNMENYTIYTKLYKQNSATPIQVASKNLTRYSKTRKQTDFMTSVQMQGVSNKVDENTRYGTHLPIKFIVMPIYLEDIIPGSIQPYINIFKFKSFTEQGLHYVPPIDLSQLHIPFKTYKFLDDYIHEKIGQTHLQNQRFILQDFEQIREIDQSVNDTSQFQMRMHNSYDYKMKLIIRIYPFHYFQFLFGFTDLQMLRKQAPLEIASDIYTQEMVDMLKQMFFQNNFYFVVLYFVLSIVQCFMRFFAFKNEIQVWQSVQQRGGLSCYIIMLLYLVDQEANTLYILFMVLDIVITLWKIGKAIKISISQKFPFIKFSYKQWYHNKTQSADTQAAHYTFPLILLLFTLFMVYKLYPIVKQIIIICLNQKGNGLGDIKIPKFSIAYSFFLESSMGFIFVFGFVMITPQLYINYRLKSVDHLPWKTLVYRFISTIIDDIFVFMISLPWLQRAFSFRDDIVFVIYLIQRKLYKVDKNRLATAGGSVDLTKIKQQDKQKLLGCHNQKQIKVQ